MNIVEIVCSSVCGLICLLHFIVTAFQTRKLKKQITFLCSKCGAENFVDVSESSLTDDQINALFAFVRSLREEVKK